MTTNGSGYYRACWVPVDTPLDVAVVENGGGSNTGSLGAAGLRSGERQVVIDPREPLDRLDLRVDGR